MNTSKYSTQSQHRYQNLQEQLREKDKQIIRLEENSKVREGAIQEYQESYKELKDRYTQEISKFETERKEVNSQHKEDIYQIEIRHKNAIEDLKEYYEEKLQLKLQDIRKHFHPNHLRGIQRRGKEGHAE